MCVCVCVSVMHPYPNALHNLLLSTDETEVNSVEYKTVTFLWFLLCQHLNSETCYKNYFKMNKEDNLRRLTVSAESVCFDV